MGTINFKTGDVITLGVKPLDSETEDTDIFYEEIRTDLETVVDAYDRFKWFRVAIDFGYYESLYIAVDRNYILKSEEEKYLFGFLDDDDREQIAKEFEKLKECLHELVDNGMVVCYPSWCTGYADAEKSHAEIDELQLQF